MWLAGLVLAASASDAPALAAQDPDAPVDLGRYGQPIRFVAGEGTVFTFDDGSRYAGTIEARLAGDGDLVIVNDVTMRTYVEGLAEVPVSWPMEALKAQAVAARTYAWYSIRLASFDGYDICDTVACQVFAGRSHVEAPEGQRWADAVAATEGEVVLYDGEPILARYFSTSGGHTRNNEDVFPSEGPRPYLVGVPDPHDEVSPLHRWEVTFTREQLDAIAARGEQLSEAVPVRDLRFVDPPTGADRVVAVREDGHEVSVPASSFRAFVSTVAPELYPDEYPSKRAGSDRPLPTTIPSSRLRFTVTDDEVVIEGRGWGHGVGMSQYGALGRAQEGQTYDQILRAYYTGAQVGAPTALPDRVRVGIDRRETPLTLRADGPFRVEVGATTVTERGLGAWSVAPAPDRTAALTAPAGYGAPLVVAPTTSSRQAPFEIEVVTLDTVVNKPTELSLELADADGELLERRDLGIVDPGRHTIQWSLDREDGTSFDRGTYLARLVAVDEEGTAAGDPAQVRIRPVGAGGAPAGMLGPAPEPVAPPRLDVPLIALAGALGAVAGGLVGGAVSRRRVGA